MDASFLCGRGVRGPGWRWQYAESVARANSPTYVRLVRDKGETLVCEAAVYLTTCLRGPQGKQRAKQEHPRIAAAHALWENASMRDRLKVLIVGNCAQEEIAQLCQTDKDVVELCEQLFYDVRALREAVGWIQGHVIDRETDAGNAALASRLSLAVCLGPVVAKLLIDLDEDSPALVDSAKKLLKKKTQLYVKLDQVLAVPFETDRERSRFMELFLNYDLAMARLRRAEHKLQERCAEACRRQEVAKLGLAQTRERQERRAAHRAGREAERQARRLWQEQAPQRQQELRIALKKLAQARAAASPLAQLRWSSQSADLAAEAGTDGGVKHILARVAGQVRGGPERSRVKLPGAAAVLAMPELAEKGEAPCRFEPGLAV